MRWAGEGLGALMAAERDVITPESPHGLEDRKMVDLRGHFSNPEALIDALEEMEKVLRQVEVKSEAAPEPSSA